MRRPTVRYAWPHPLEDFRGDFLNISKPDPTGNLGSLTVCPSKLQSIFDMSDSEDEVVLPLPADLDLLPQDQPWATSAGLLPGHKRVKLDYVF